MRNKLTILLLAVTGVAACAGVVLGIAAANVLICAVSVVVLTCVGVGTTLWWRRKQPRDPAGNARCSAAPAVWQAFQLDAPSAVNDRGERSHAAAVRMIETDRYAFLTRSRIYQNLSDSLRAEALAVLRNSMALVPTGAVRVGQEIPESEDDHPFATGRVVSVAAFYLDRHCVTNRQYRAFVDAGGYAESALWSPDIWPSVPDFVDRSGRPGPRFWVHGAPAPGEDDHPVAGVSWFEAEAYARWVGKRLPTGSEWVKAASWPVTVGNELAGQRKFPWGNAMDRRRANLWGSGPGHTLPVTALPEGASVGNIAQLCGNVWEWTADDFGVGRRPQDRIQSTIPWKAIRGGAFDTYFDNHVSNDFQSGEHPLSRKANIGFRCALSRCDVAGDEPVAGPLEVTGEVPVDVAGEVPVEELVDATFEERAAEPVSEPVEEELAVVACGEDRP